MTQDNHNKTQPEWAIENEIIEIEKFISRALLPVKPRDEFIYELRNRLAKNEDDRLNSGNFYQFMVLVAVGLFGGLIIIIGAIKAILSLRQAVKVLRQQPNIQTSIANIDSTRGISQGASPSNH